MSRKVTLNSTIILSIFFSDKPYCRPDQQDVYGVATRETIRIPCDVIADPSKKVTFEWVFNTSTEWYPMPPADPEDIVGVTSLERGFTRAYVEHTPKVNKSTWSLFTIYCFEFKAPYFFSWRVYSMPER